MTINKQALIAKIKKQTESFDTVILKEDEANALLDELEAAGNRINRLESIVAVAEKRNALMREWKRALKVPCDLVDDQVPVVIHGMVVRLDRLKETEEKLAAAEKRIAELEKSHCGAPLLEREEAHVKTVSGLLAELGRWQQESSTWQSVAEKQLAIAIEAERRIAELEAREVKLPPNELVTDTWTSPGDGWEVFDAQKVIDSIRSAGVRIAAGITVKGDSE